MPRRQGRATRPATWRRTLRITMPALVFVLADAAAHGAGTTVTRPGARSPRTSPRPWSRISGAPRAAPGAMSGACRLRRRKPTSAPVQGRQHHPAGVRRTPQRRRATLITASRRRPRSPPDVWLDLPSAGAPARKRAGQRRLVAGGLSDVKPVRRVPAPRLPPGRASSSAPPAVRLALGGVALCTAGHDSLRVPAGGCRTAERRRHDTPAWLRQAGV